MLHQVETQRFIFRRHSNCEAYLMDYEKKLQLMLYGEMSVYVRSA